MKSCSVLMSGFIVLICACSTNQYNSYFINGTTDIPDGELIRLVYSISSDSTFSDSCIISEGRFSFKGDIDKPELAYVFHGKSITRNKHKRTIMLEPAEYSIRLYGDDFHESPVFGSQLTLQMDSLDSKKKIIYEQIDSLYQSIISFENDSVRMDDFNRKHSGFRQQLDDIQIDFMMTHPDSYVSPVVMKRIMINLPFDRIKEIISSWDAEILSADQSILDYISALEIIQPGKMAPEISGKDQNGSGISLSALKGKVVLIDFWATWCGPCRAALPHVKEIYKRYHDKGLEVLCVSLDFNEEPWKKFIAESDMDLGNYHHVYERGCGWASKDAKKYAVKGIPAKFLIDRDGIIIGKFDSNEDLDAKLAEIFTE